MAMSKTTKLSALLFYVPVVALSLAVAAVLHAAVIWLIMEIFSSTQFVHEGNTWTRYGCFGTNPGNEYYFVFLSFILSVISTAALTTCWARFRFYNARGESTRERPRMLGRLAKATVVAFALCVLLVNYEFYLQTDKSKGCWVTYELSPTCREKVDLPFRGSTPACIKEEHIPRLDKIHFPPFVNIQKKTEAELLPPPHPPAK
jgi:hypothetical protein